MIKKLKLSPWHDGSVKPVHVGVYQRKHNDKFDHFSFWDGAVWHALKLTPIDAFYSKNESTYFSKLPWRGVLK